MAGHTYAHDRARGDVMPPATTSPAVEIGRGNAATVEAMPPPPTQEPGLLDTLAGGDHQQLAVGDDYATTTPDVLERMFGGTHPGAYRNLSLQVGLRVGKIASLGATVKLAGRLWMEDDLAFRTAMAAELQVDARIRAWIIDLGMSGTLKREWQHVYRSPRHFTIHVMEYFDAVVEALLEADEAAQQSKDAPTRDARLAADAPRSVVSSTAELGVSAQAGGDRGGQATRSRTWNRFENDEGDILLGTADRTALEVDLGPAWTVRIEHNLIDGHQFPDNNGSFLTLTVSANRDIASTIHPQAYRDIATALAREGRQIRATGMQDLGKQIGAAWRGQVQAANFDNGKGRSAVTHLTGDLVWHLIDSPSEGFDLETQYVRILGGFDANERIQVPAGGAILQGGYDINSRFRAFEMAGAGTSSYFQKFYNGLRRQDPATSGDFVPPVGWVPDGWEAHAANNQRTLWALFANLAHQSRAGSGTLLSELSGTALHELALKHYDQLVDTVSEPQSATADVARPGPRDPALMTDFTRALTEHYNSTPLVTEDGWVDPAQLDGLDIDSVTFAEGDGFVAQGASSDTWEALYPALTAGLEVDIDSVKGPWTLYGMGLELGPGLEQASQAIQMFAAETFSIGPIMGLNVPYFEFFAPADRERMQSLSEQARTGYLTDADDVAFMGEAQERMLLRFQDALMATRLTADRD